MYITMHDEIFEVSMQKFNYSEVRLFLKNITIYISFI